MLSFGQSILVIDPLKVFVITAIISFLIRRPYDDETLDFSDPFTATLVSNENLADTNDHDRSDDLKVKGNVGTLSSEHRHRIRLFEIQKLHVNDASVCSISDRSTPAKWLAHANNVYTSSRWEILFVKSSCTCSSPLF